MIVLAKDNKENLINFIAKHQIENTRKSHINELKDGFNIFNLINVCIYLLLIKMNYLNYYILTFFYIFRLSKITFTILLGVILKQNYTI